MNRVLALVRAQLSGEVLGERTPFAALAMQFVVAAMLCAIVRGEVGGFGYALFALSVPLALTTVPLLGELGPLLRADPAVDWVGALPVTARDLRLARVLTLLTIVGMLCLASLVPAALLAPSGFGALDRLALVVGGLLQTWWVAALLLGLQSVLFRAGDGVSVLLQTLVFLGVLVGMLVGLRSLPFLESLAGDEAFVPFLPQAWFAWPMAVSGGATLAAIAGIAIAIGGAILVAAPFAPAPRARSTRSILSTILSPLRRLAEFLWVKTDERGAFAFVYDALPAERDFVIRTYPLVAAPLLFLVFGADPDRVEGEGLFALLLFAPAAYLPFVLMHVPTTASPDARWIVDTSPQSEDSEDRGALKAVAVRLLAPLYLGIGVLVWALASADLALRVWPVAVAAGLVTLRILWRVSGTARPLSTRANDLASTWNEGLGGHLIAVSIAMTLLAVLAWRRVPSIAFGWVVLGAVVAVELLVHGRRGRTNGD